MILRDLNGDPEKNRKRKIKRHIIYVSVSLLLVLYSVPFILSTKNYCENEHDIKPALASEPAIEEDFINKL